MMALGKFIEVIFNNYPTVAEGRNVKILYAKAVSGQLKKFKVCESPYGVSKISETHYDAIRVSTNKVSEQTIKQARNSI